MGVHPFNTIVSHLHNLHRKSGPWRYCTAEKSREYHVECIGTLNSYWHSLVTWTGTPPESRSAIWDVTKQWIGSLFQRIKQLTWFLFIARHWVVFCEFLALFQSNQWRSEGMGVWEKTPNQFGRFTHWLMFGRWVSLVHPYAICSFKEFLILGRMVSSCIHRGLACGRMTQPWFLFG